jgi:hypothetical protein
LLLIPLSLLEILDRTTIQAVDAMANMGLADVAVMLLIQSDDTHAPELLERIEKICARHGAQDVARSSDPVEASMLLEARRLAFPALERLGDWLLDDVAVPRSRIVDLIAAVEEISTQFAVQIGVFGHAGDGNLHPTVIFNDADPDSRAAARHAFDRITGQALALGGTITGEHGVGLLKRSGWPSSSRTSRLLSRPRSKTPSTRPASSTQPRSSTLPAAPMPGRITEPPRSRACTRTSLAPLVTGRPLRPGLPARCPAGSGPVVVPAAEAALAFFLGRAVGSRFAERVAALGEHGGAVG